MISSKQIRREARGLFKACVSGGKLDEKRVTTVVDTLLDKRPHGYLSILKEFQRLIRQEIDRSTATVETATGIDAEVKSGIEKKLKQEYGDGLIINFKENAALIGGMRVKVGSDVFDGSVSARLQALGESF